MKVLLIRDVYKLGRAGEVKKVADGYGRNYLIPQGLAILATEGALKQAERISQAATKERVRLNEELGAYAEQLSGLELVFPVKASETGRLYGSISAAMISQAIHEKMDIEIERRKIDIQPIKTLGVHRVSIRLTIDLVPEIMILVHREGEPPESAYEVEIGGREIEEEVPPYLFEEKTEVESGEQEGEAGEGAEEPVVEAAESAADEALESPGEEAQQA